MKSQSTPARSPAPVCRRILKEHPQPFIKVVADWQFLVVMVLLLIATNWLGHRWLFAAGTLSGTDVLLSSARKQYGSHCWLVTIDEQEFNDSLGETIDPQKLAVVLNRILEFKPKVLVVDVDTAPPRFRGLQLAPTETKIVWARSSHEELKPVAGGRNWEIVWKSDPVLGNRPDQPAYVGSPLFPQDPDGRVRGFQRFVRIDALTPSLHWEALRAYCDSGNLPACGRVQNADVGEPAETRPFDTNWDFYVEPISDFLGKDTPAPSQPESVANIIVVGANFDDIHPTSFGPKLGVELVASAIESELKGQHGLQVHGWMVWIVKVLLALAIAWLNSRLDPLWATAGTLLLITAVFLASFIGFYFRVFQMDFLPFMIGIWIEQLVETATHAHKAHS